MAFDPARLRTEQDWVQAGEIVFDAPLFEDTAGPFAFAGIADSLKDPAWYRQTGTPVAKDGTVPFLRYVIRKKGVLEIGLFSCGMCHTRIMADGTVLKGAQGNFPFEAVAVGNARKYEDKPGVIAFFRRVGGPCMPLHGCGRIPSISSRPPRSSLPARRFPQASSHGSARLRFRLPRYPISSASRTANTSTGAVWRSNATSAT